MNLTLRDIDPNRVVGYVAVVRLDDGTIAFPFEVDADDAVARQEIALALLYRAQDEIAGALSDIASEGAEASEL